MSEDEAAFTEKLNQLIAMGYDAVVARNALEAADGNVETAVELILAEETNNLAINEASPIGATEPDEADDAAIAAAATEMEVIVTKTEETKDPKEAVDRLSQQLSPTAPQLNPQVKARAQEAGQAVKNVWSSAVTKLKEFDEKNQISSGAKGAMKTCDEKIKAFDEKLQLSQKTKEAGRQVGEVYQRTVESAKKTLVPQKETTSMSVSASEPPEPSAPAVPAPVPAVPAPTEVSTTSIES